jgi:hypothetical protein
MKIQGEKFTMAETYITRFFFILSFWFQNIPYKKLSASKQPRNFV